MHDLAAQALEQARTQPPEGGLNTLSAITQLRDELIGQMMTLLDETLTS
jgi:hypothetical protein